MRLTRAQLAFKALVALHEVDRAIVDGATVPKSAQLRFLLAYLHSISDPDQFGLGDRQAFIDFWRAVTENDPAAANPHAQNTGRRNVAHASIASIARRIQLPLDIDMTAAVARALRGKPHHTHRDDEEKWLRVMEQLARTKQNK